MELGRNICMAREETSDAGTKGHGETTPEHDFPRISQPALRALLGAGYTHLDQLTAVTEADLLRLHGMGQKALGQLRDALHARGQSLADGR
jgi:hypothetical protein